MMHIFINLFCNNGSSVTASYFVIHVFSGGPKDTFDQYISQLLQRTAPRCYLPPIQRGHQHVFRAEHTTRDILSLVAQAQGVKMPRKYGYIISWVGENLKAGLLQALLMYLKSKTVMGSPSTALEKSQWSIRWEGTEYSH